MVNFTKKMTVSAGKNKIWGVFAHDFNNAYTWMASVPKSYHQSNGDTFAGAKTDCSNSLAKASVLYEEGNFVDCIGTLKPCMSSIPQDRIYEAHRFLALSYMSLNNNDSANFSIANLLKAKPDYTTFPFFDPTKFSNMLSAFDVYPKWELGIVMGINLSTASPTTNYSITNSPASFVSKNGYQVGFLAEHYLQKRLSIQAKLQLQGIGYGRNADDVTGWKQEYTERMTLVNIPLVARYNLLPDFSGWKISAEAGLGVQFLSSTNSVIFLEDLRQTSGNKLQRSTDQINARNQMLMSGILGVSAKHQFGEAVLGIEVRSSLGMSNLVKSENRWDNFEFITANNYVDSDIRLNTMSFNITYQRAIRGKYSVKLK
jgi:hypothetical protein